MIGDALAQFESPDIGIIRQSRPFGGQNRNNRTRHIALKQRVIHLMRQRMGWAFIL